jgi:hypothetical protein
MDSSTLFETLVKFTVFIIATPFTLAFLNRKYLLSIATQHL